MTQVPIAPNEVGVCGAADIQPAPFEVNTFPLAPGLVNPVPPPEAAKVPDNAPAVVAVVAVVAVAALPEMLIGYVPDCKLVVSA
jgi:hypothetical protein